MTFWRISLLVLGVFACSTAAIWIKSIDASSVHWSLIAAYRLLLAALILAPLFARDLRRHRARYARRHLRRSLLPGVILAAHFLTWIPGVQLTLAANASLVVNMVPVAMPFLLYALMRERLNAGEWAATALAVAGVALLAAADYRFSPQLFLGDVICFASMILFALYLALGRLNRDFPSIWLYLVPLYFAAGLVCFAASLAFTRPWAVGSAADVLCIVGLAVVPTVLGHSALNWSMRHIRGQVVGVVNLGQFIFAGVMGYLLLRPPEVPPWTFYPAAALVVAGAYLALRATPARLPAPPAEAP
jgi:drug/metabolite transporter (DMT)-like permease